MNTSRTLRILFVFILGITLYGCGSSMNAVWEKTGFSGGTYNKIAVIMIDKNMELRQSMESAIIADIRKTYPNKEFITGLSLFPPNVDKSEWNEQNVEALLKENQVDAVITTAMIDSYLSKELANDAYPYYYPDYMGIGGYMWRTYDYMYDPVQYETAQNFVLQSSLFDLSQGSGKKETMVWQGESSVTDPSSISGGAGAYADNLVDYLIKHNLIH